MSIGVMLFCPFTGKPRHPSDIASDPEGILVWDGETPLRAAKPAQQPLTDEQIEDAVREADLDWQQGWTLDEDAPNRFTTLVRAIEQVHGITGEKK